jgi:glutathione S-transferase
MALSTLLGDKPYFFGTTPCTLDATAFGLLVEITDTPIDNSNIKEFVEKSTPNLLNFVRRIKRDYWPDWDILCKNLVMNASDVSEKH